MSSPESPVPTTRSKILQESARLFGRRGYLGASTRDIAAAVGVRQQSLQHHFPTKKAILEELLAIIFTEPLQAATAMAVSEGSPAVRLYAYIRFDVAHLHDAPYPLQGIVGTYLLDDPDLVKWYQAGSDIYDAVAAMVVEGMVAGEFRSLDAEFAAAAVGALIEQTLNPFEQYASISEVPVLVADFCLSGLLRDPSALDTIRRQAMALDPTGPKADSTVLGKRGRRR